MIDHDKKPFLPLKSVPVALLFCVFLGPIGVLYSSTLAGAILIVIGFIVACVQLPVPIILVWLISCICGVAAANKYNKKLMKLINKI